MGKLLVCGLCTCALALGCGSDPGYPIGDDDTQDPDATPGPDADPGDIDAGSDGGGGGGDAGDDQPPAIVVITPTPGSMVAGVITLHVDVIEDGGSPPVVTATIAGTHEISMAHQGGTSWRGTYDTAPLAGLVFPTILVRARDEAGNESQVGFEVTLDNEAPILGLDPPRVRESRFNSDGLLECSRSFDPVGDDAPDDGETVAQLIELRARVVDLPNTGTSTSQVYVPRAGIDDTTVSLYVLDDTTRPLIVDSDGDGVCDALNPEIVPTSFPMTANEAAVLDLVPVPGEGSSYFTGPGVGDGFAGSNTGCVAGTATTAPGVLCLAAAPATRVPVTPFEAAPMIYVIPPVAPLACMGYAFDARASNISEGWACTAVVASDALGNRRISPVTRICVDADQDQSDGCLAWGDITPLAQRPDCTGTYNPATEVVTTTPCTPPTSFADSGVAGDYELIHLD